MCGSRKYPYPTTGGISLSFPPPPPPWIFHIYKELVTHPPPTPPLRNFHKVRQTPTSPSGKVYFDKNGLSK